MVDDSVSPRVCRLIEPSLTARGLELVDLEHRPGWLRVTVDRPGGVDLDAVSDISRLISERLDADDVVPGRYTLEVSSPGVERPLRTPAHFRRFVGTTVAVKLGPGAEGERRVEGTLEAADDDRVVVAGRVIPYGEIERARTVFRWGAAPKPARGKRSRQKASA